MDLADALAARGLDWIVPQWPAPARVAAFFTTRQGDAADLRALVPADPVWLSQVHGRDVAIVDEANAAALRATPPRADAAVTRASGIPVAIRTADCLPVLLCDRAGSVLAVAHAGWRGLAAGVLEATLDAMDVPPANVVAWIGPAIGPRAFEVGADVHEAFCATDPGAAFHFVAHREGKWLADLPALARRRLAARGVPDIAGGPWCTVTDSERFFSWRRDKATGRMALAAWLW